MTRRCLNCDYPKLTHELNADGAFAGVFAASVCFRYRAPFWWRRLRGRK